MNGAWALAIVLLPSRYIPEKNKTKTVCLFASASVFP